MRKSKYLRLRRFLEILKAILKIIEALASLMERWL